MQLAGARSGLVRNSLAAGDTASGLIASAGLTSGQLATYLESARTIAFRLQAPVLDVASDGVLRAWHIGLPRGSQAEDIVDGWLRAQGLGDALYVQHRSIAGLCVDVHLFRGASSEPFADAELALLTHLIPVMSGLIELAEKASQLQRFSDLSQCALDSSPHGILLLSSNGVLLGANAIGVEILAENDGLSAGPAGLLAGSPSETARLRQFLVLADDGALDFPCYLSLPRPSGRSDLQLSLTPVRNGIQGFSDGPDRVLIVGEPDDPRELEVRALVTLLGLTNAEARLLAGLAQGRSMQEQCSHMGIKISTARTYLARMLSKTGTRRQPELIGLALRSLAQLPNS